MADIDPPPPRSPAEVAATAAKRAALVALNTRPSRGEDLVALKQTFEILKAEFLAEEEVRSKAQQVISARIKALLDDDVATGRLVLTRKNESDYVKIVDLVRWAVDIQRALFSAQIQPSLFVN